MWGQNCENRISLIGGLKKDTSKNNPEFLKRCISQAACSSAIAVILKLVEERERGTTTFNGFKCPEAESSLGLEGNELESERDFCKTAPEGPAHLLKCGAYKSFSFSPYKNT